jgi:hypothetical protein
MGVPSTSHVLMESEICEFWDSDIIALTRSESQSHIVTDGQSLSKSWCQAPSGAHDQIFIAVWQFQFCFHGAPSLTRGLVCILYMLLALASAVFFFFFGSKSLGIRDHILLSQIWDFPFHHLLRLTESWVTGLSFVRVQLYKPWHQWHRKHCFHGYSVLFICCCNMCLLSCGNAFSLLLPSSGQFLLVPLFQPYSCCVKI